MKWNFSTPLASKFEAEGVFFVRKTPHLTMFMLKWRGQQKNLEVAW